MSFTLSSPCHETAESTGDTTAHWRPYEPAARSDDSQPHVLVLVPAHDEEDVIRDTLESLRRQTRPADRIVVVLDNCTDSTAAIAMSMGVEIFTTIGNGDKKAGALNQALEKYLPTLRDGDGVLVMDADTTLNSTFIEASLEHHAHGVGGVGGATSRSAACCVALRETTGS